MISSITVHEGFPLRPGEILRVKPVPSKSVELITVGNELEESNKTVRRFAARSRVVELGTNKPHVSSRNMERIPRYASIRDIYYKD